MIISDYGFLTISLLSGIFIIANTNRVHIMLKNLFTASGFKAAVFPLILYYGFIIILPLLIIIVVLFLAHSKVEEQAGKNAKSEHKKENWIKHYHKVLTFMMSMVMLITGLILLFI